MFVEGDFYVLSCDENHYFSPFGRNIFYFFQPLNKQIKAWEEDFFGASFVDEKGGG